ncbi:DUF1190 domain-containing protein [Leisingera caerulea]|uniref:DUF1190 domain-containing protein n=1 Tax=Leisingera caerulea TaxID=506591 RepID=UPI0012B5CE98|nr:DUF1190 domain-containing protein [Leisingera caerulea]
MSKKLGTVLIAGGIVLIGAIGAAALLSPSTPVDDKPYARVQAPEPVAPRAKDYTAQVIDQCLSSTDLSYQECAEIAPEVTEDLVSIRPHPSQNVCENEYGVGACHQDGAGMFLPIAAMLIATELVDEVGDYYEKKTRAGRTGVQPIRTGKPAASDGSAKSWSAASAPKPAVLSKPEPKTMPATGGSTENWAATSRSVPATAPATKPVSLSKPAPAAAPKPAPSPAAAGGSTENWAATSRSVPATASAAKPVSLSKPAPAAAAKPAPKTVPAASSSAAPVQKSAPKPQRPAVKSPPVQRQRATPKRHSSSKSSTRRSSGNSRRRRR